MEELFAFNNPTDHREQVRGPTGLSVQSAESIGPAGTHGTHRHGPGHVIAQPEGNWQAMA